MLDLGALTPSEPRWKNKQIEALRLLGAANYGKATRKCVILTS